MDLWQDADGSHRPLSRVKVQSQQVFDRLYSRVFSQWRRERQELRVKSLEPERDDEARLGASCKVKTAGFGMEIGE